MKGLKNSEFGELAVSENYKDLRHQILSIVYEKICHNWFHANV